MRRRPCESSAVIKTDEFFYYDVDQLTPQEQTNFHAVHSGGPSAYGYSNFKADVTRALTDRFGQVVSLENEP